MARRHALQRFKLTPENQITGLGYGSIGATIEIADSNHAVSSSQPSPGTDPYHDTRLRGWKQTDQIKPDRVVRVSAIPCEMQNCNGEEEVAGNR